MTYAVKYLAGAYKTAGGSEGGAVANYARGYYHQAARRGLSPYEAPGAAAFAMQPSARSIRVGQMNCRCRRPDDRRPPRRVLIAGSRRRLQPPARLRAHSSHRSGTDGSLAQVITTLTSKMPTHRAVRGGAMNGADCISVAEPTQYAPISVSSGSHDFDGLPRTTQGKRAGFSFGFGLASVLGPGGPGSPCGPAGPRSPRGPGSRPLGPCGPAGPIGPTGPAGPASRRSSRSTTPPFGLEPWPNVIEALAGRCDRANVDVDAAHEFIAGERIQRKADAGAASNSQYPRHPPGHAPVYDENVERWRPSRPAQAPTSSHGVIPGRAS